MDLKISVAICPPADFVDQVDHLKNRLYEAIGWYPSRNSKAHITFNVAVIPERSLEPLESLVEKFCHRFAPFVVAFDRAETFQNGAFFLAPTPAAHAMLVQVMTAFHGALNETVDAGSLRPHMSIARQLNPGQLSVATALFTQEDLSLSFTCTGLAIRVFDPVKRQYSIHREFPFEGTRIPGNDQVDLFSSP